MLHALVVTLPLLVVVALLVLQGLRQKVPVTGSLQAVGCWLLWALMTWLLPQTKLKQRQRQRNHTLPVVHGHPPVLRPGQQLTLHTPQHRCQPDEAIGPPPRA